MLRPVLLCALAVPAISGCHRPKTAASAPAAVTAVEEHCWWSVDRSILPADSVVDRFRRAFATTGFTSVTWAKLADTTWTHAGPTAVNPAQPDVGYEVRAVAYQRGDSAHFRLFVGALPLPPAHVLPANALAGDVSIPLCARVAGEDAIPTVRLRQRTGEESLPVWRHRRPDVRS
jgi:hypothetical protein